MACRKPVFARLGFSLVELLVLIAVLAVVGGLSIRAVQAVREAGNRSECGNHLKQIGQAIQLYHDNNQRLPPSRLDNETASWAWLILPYLDQENLFMKWDFHAGRLPGYERFTATPVATYFCPSRRSPDFPISMPGPSEPGCMSDGFSGAVGDYAASVGSSGWDGYIPAGYVGIWTPEMFDPPNGAFQAGKGVRLQEITDGLSSTLLVGDKNVPQFSLRSAPYDCSIYDGHNLSCHSRFAGDGFPLAGSGYPGVDLAFGSNHSHVVQFVFADGTVHAITTALDPSILGLLANRDDGQTPEFE